MRIQINLLPGGKRKRAAGGGFKLPDFKELIASVKDPLLIGAVAAWVVAVAVLAVMFLSQQGTVNRLEAERSRVQRESARFQGLLNRKARAQTLRDSLAVELQAIREIDADRYIWPHIMNDVTMALPAYAWLSGVRFQAAQSAVGDTARPPLRIMIVGRAVEMPAYTRFIRQLNASPWLRDIDPGATQTLVEEGTTIYTFTVNATFQQADSTYIQTVPVTDWVR